MLKILSACFLACLVSGCGTFYELAIPAQSQELPAIPEGKAQVVFMRPNSGGFGMSSFSAFVVDITGEKDDLLGVFKTATKLVVHFDPGSHRLFASGGMEKGHIMEMTVEEGKRYYVLVRPKYGHGFQLRPIKHRDNYPFSYSYRDFKPWVARSKMILKADDADLLYKKWKPKFDKAKTHGFAGWDKMNEKQRGELTLLPEDAEK